MTTINDFSVTGLQAKAAQYNLLLGSIFRGEISNATTMSGTVTLTDGDTAIQRFNCNGANRIVKLPAYSTSNHPYFIINTTAATYTLDVQTNAGVTYLSTPLAANGGHVLLLPDGVAGFYISGSLEPLVAPSTVGNIIMTLNGTTWSSVANDGWIPVTETWTYASASTITIPTDGTTKYKKGMLIRLKQGGAYKYFTAYSVAATLITVVVNTDYTVANAAITDVWYGFGDAYGFPSSFTFTSTLTASTTNPTGLTTTGKYTVNPGGIKVFVSSVAGASPTNGSGYYIWSVPFSSAVAGVGPMHISNANVGRYTGSAYQTGGTVIGITSAGLVTNASPIATLEVNDEFDFSMDLLW